MVGHPTKATPESSLNAVRSSMFAAHALLEWMADSKMATYNTAAFNGYPFSCTETQWRLEGRPTFLIHVCNIAVRLVLRHKMGFQFSVHLRMYLAAVATNPQGWRIGISWILVTLQNQDYKYPHLKTFPKSLAAFRQSMVDNRLSRSCNSASRNIKWQNSTP